MKFIKIILLLLLTQIGYSQDSLLNNALINYPDNQLWTNNQIYQMAESYNIQDSLFLSSGTIKEEFSLVLYMPQKDLVKFFDKLKDIYDTERYFAEINNISTIDEWLSLLGKYPGFSNSLINDKEFTQGLSFQDFVNKTKNQEILLFLDEGAIVVVPNTSEEYNIYKHLKRLK